MAEKDGAAMRIELIGATEGWRNLEPMLKFGRDNARVCYTDKDFVVVQNEQDKAALMDRLLTSGHHSPFEHTTLSFYMQGLPKIMAMVLNNEQDMATSEKSARYTRMEDIEPVQNALYDKWMDRLTPLIGAVYPAMGNSEDRQVAIKKLVQENARYMTSVFTPTKMTHTLSLRQLNFIAHEMEALIPEYRQSGNPMFSRLADCFEAFIAQEDIAKFREADLTSKIEHHLSLFQPHTVAPHFADTYAINYLMSFAGLAQAHRHRTIDYHISGGHQPGAPLGFFIPGIILPDRSLVREWTGDLEEVATSDFPQAQFLKVNETGTPRHYISKMRQRLCGHAQYEIMKNTQAVAEMYGSVRPEIAANATSRCKIESTGCDSPCVWGPANGLTRVV
ncbi:MAG: FAD-dependent thymidylate synthase [archaeon]